MINIEDLKSLLSTKLITIGEQPINIGDVLIIPLVLLIGYWLTKALVRFVSSRLERRNTDPNVIHLLQRLFYVIAIIVLVITILDLVNIPITAFAFLSGAIAIGVGFGAQNIINNFISGWILMWEKPIRIGDFLEVETTKGIVEEINTRSTRIRRVDGVHLLIPNSKLLENTVVNWTLVDRLVRTSVTVGVAYGSPAQKVADLIMEATVMQSEVLKDPKPFVSFEDFGDNSLVFETTFWIKANVEGGLRIVRSNIRFSIDKLFADNGIVIAFPQRDVHIDGSITVKKDQAT